MKETNPEITLTPEQTIEKLLDNFDFHKVHKAMVALQWEYYDSDKVPDIDRIKTFARSALFRSLSYSKFKKKKATASSGGFTATARKYKDGEILFSLDFRVADFNWSNRDTCY